MKGSVTLMNSMIKSNFSFIFVVIASSMFILISGCNVNSLPEEQSLVQPPLSTEQHTVEQPAPTQSEADSEPAAPASYTKDVRIMAVGDIMMHSPQIPSGYNAKTDTYNYDAFFSEIKPVFSGGDWVIGNLETPLAGKEAGFSGYPQFNAPAELADALKTTGFHIITTANNHALDRREKGVLRTLDNLRSHGLLPVGTAGSQEEADEIALFHKNGICMAVLAYTYGTNGIPIPEGKPYLVNLINENKIIADIRKAREGEADVVTVALHFGHEYHLHPSQEQIGLAHRLIAAGADIILGSHPHVVQPYEQVVTTAADGTKRTGVVIYSLGNFISNQDRSYTKKPTDIGVIFSLTVRKHFPEGNIELLDVEIRPTYVHRYVQQGKRQYRVLPIDSVVTSKNDPILTSGDYKKLEDYLQESLMHIQSMTAAVDKPMQ